MDYYVNESHIKYDLEKIENVDDDFITHKLKSRYLLYDVTFSYDNVNIQKLPIEVVKKAISIFLKIAKDGIEHQHNIIEFPLLRDVLSSSNITNNIEDAYVKQFIELLLKCDVNFIIDILKLNSNLYKYMSNDIKQKIENKIKNENIK